MPTPSGISSDISQNPQINGVAVAAAGQTTAQCIVRLHQPNFTLQAKAVCTAATGTWKVEFSNDLVDWNDVTAYFTPALTNPAALTGTNLNFATCPPTVGGWRYARITFTITVGSAVITVTVAALASGAN